jgi:hypothetical protein
MSAYILRRPISSDPHLAREGMVVSRHETLEAVEEALCDSRAGAQAQGGYSQDYLWDETAQARISW